MRRIPTALPGFFIVAALLISGHAPAVATQGAPPKILRLQWHAMPKTLEPQQSDTGQAGVVYLAFEGLTLTFHLRDNLTSSDGSPLTAERFRSAIERQCDPHHKFRDVDALFVIAGCEALRASLREGDGTPVADEAAFEIARANLGARPRRPHAGAAPDAARALLPGTRRRQRLSARQAGAGRSGWRRLVAGPGQLGRQRPVPGDGHRAG
jgi:hypothetical protein